MWSRINENQLKGAIERNSLTEVTSLIAAGNIDLANKNDQDETFLHLAARAEDPEILALLLSNLEDHPDFLKLINAGCKRKITPLLAARRARKTKNVLLLLNKYQPHTFLEDENDISFFNLNGLRIHTFNTFTPEARLHLLNEHRYYILLNPFIEHSRLEHLEWARRISLKAYLQEKLWLEKKPHELSAQERYLINSDHETDVETKIRREGFVRYLKKCIAILHDNYRNSYEVNLNFCSISIDLPKHKPAKLRLIASLVGSPLFFATIAAVGLALFATAAIFLSILSLIIFIPPVFIIIISSIPAIILGGIGLLNYIRMIISDINTLKEQDEFLKTTIANMLPEAKFLLEKLQYSKDTKFANDIERMDYCIRFIEKGGSIFSDEELIKNIEELSQLIEKNITYLYPDVDERSVEYKLADVVEPRPASRIRTSGKKRIVDFPELAQNPSALFQPAQAASDEVGVKLELTM